MDVGPEETSSSPHMRRSTRVESSEQIACAVRNGLFRGPEAQVQPAFPVDKISSRPCLQPRLVRDSANLYAGNRPGKCEK